MSNLQNPVPTETPLGSSLVRIFIPGGQALNMWFFIFDNSRCSFQFHYPISPNSGGAKALSLTESLNKYSSRDKAFNYVFKMENASVCECQAKLDLHGKFSTLLVHWFMHLIDILDLD